MRLLVGFLLALASAVVQAQSYPTRPVRMIIPFPPGGSNDVVGRSIANQLGERLGQTVVIDNRGGAGGAIGTDAAAKAAPDGYTLLLISVSLPMNIGLGRMRPDALKAFAPVSMLGTGPAVLCVPASSPASTLAEFIALAKGKPGELNAATAGIGSFQHLATELFRLQAGVDVVIVQYKGGGPALTDLLAGQVQMNLGSLIQMLPHIRAGKIKALGVGGAKRSGALPDVPTISEAGVPGYEANNWWGILAPAGTPPAVLGRLQHEVDGILESPDMRKRFQAEGGDVLRMTPGEFGDFIASETAKWTRVVKQAGIKPE